MQKAFFGLILSFSASQAWAFGLPLPKGDEKLSEHPNFTAGYDFTGIVSASNCSGSLIKFDDSEPSDLALVLTNGHCYSMMNPGKAVAGLPSTRSFTLLTASGGRAGTVQSQKLVYATMTDTDIAIYQLNQTYSQIWDNFKIEALTLARDVPEMGDAIDVVSGYWKRGFTCSVEFVTYKLKEGDWYFKNSLRYSRPGCETYGGTSGSPVIASGTKTVIAINNTGNESGYKCTVNNPCEIDEQGNITYQRGYSYGQQTASIYTCRDENRLIDPSVQGCILPRP